MSAQEAPSQSFNLEKAKILVLDGDAMSIAILSQILAGFGARGWTKCASDEEARAHVQKTEYDLIVVDPSTVGTGAYSFIPWLRRSCPPPNRFVPVLIVTGHTQAARVAQLRDCGANFVVAKPLTPACLHERISWVAREKRPYVEAKAYAGPDRRFKFSGPPVGSDGRRDGDMSAVVGDASQPNMSQEDIDAMVQPRKVSL